MQNQNQTEIRPELLRSMGFEVLTPIDQEAELKAGLKQLKS